MEDFKRELKLTLENTESIYKVALGMTDFDWQGEQVDNLYCATVQQIIDNGGDSATLHTDHDVKDVLEVIATTANTLQYEARN